MTLSSPKLLPLKRLVTKLLTYFIVPGKEIEVADGRKFLAVQERVFWKVYFFKNYERLITMTIERIVRDGDVLVDVGANFGWYTTLFGKLAKNGQIYGYEPNSLTFDLLKKNIRLNNLTNNVDIGHFAVSSEQGKTVFLAAEKGNTAVGHVLGDLRGADDGEAVATVTLDNELSDHYGKISVVKIDVEGHEYEVLLGMEKIIKDNNPPVLIMEINVKNLSRGGSSKQKVMDYLTLNNYRIYHFTSNEIVAGIAPDELEDHICIPVGEFGSRISML